MIDFEYIFEVYFLTICDKGLSMSQQLPNNNRVFHELPKMHTTYANIIKSLIPIGDKSAKSSDLPKTIYKVPKLVVDMDNLTEYRNICGFLNDGRIPITYFSVLSQNLQMNMMAKEDFPFTMLGLIHLHNSTTQYRVIYDSEVVAMTVRLDNLRAHDKGQQFDFITEVLIDDKLVWSGISTYLSRQKIVKASVQKNTVSSKLVHAINGIDVMIKVPEDIGRQYAFVSGDFNLIHLHPLSARAFGYPKAIAHGMWSKARALAEFKQLPESYRVNVDFKLPIFLPSMVQMLAVPTDEQGDYRFGIYAKDGDKPHLLGEIMTI